MARTRKNRFVSLDEDDDFVNLLVYGNSGVGKTVLCGSDDKVAFIAPEDKGTRSARVLGSTAQRWPVNTWDDLYEAYQYLADIADSGEKIPFNWLAIDSLTEMQELGMGGLLKKAVDENPSRDEDIPALQDYLKNQAMVRRMIKGFNALPVNVIYTAHVLQYANAEGGEEIIPNIKGGAKRGHTFSKEICGMMTSFGYLQTKRVKDEAASEEAGKLVKTERRVIVWREKRTEAEGVITAKDRTNVLAPQTVLPNDYALRHIRELIEGGNAQPKPTARRAARSTRTNRSTTTRTTRTRQKERASA